MVLRPVARLEAEDGARVFEVPVDTPDADTDRGRPVRICVVVRNRPAPHLTGPVEPGRTRRRLVGHLRKFSGLVVAPGDQGTPGRLVLPGTHSRAAGGSDDAADPSTTHGFEDVVGADDVRPEDVAEV